MQILPALENGGVERGAIDVAKYLKNHEFTPIVVSNGGILTYQLQEAKILHIKLPIHSKNPITIFKNIKRLENLIKKYRVDIVHVRSRAPMISAYFACKNTNRKLVSTVHGTYSLGFLKWENFPLKRIYNAFMLKADAIIVVSNFIKEYLFKNYQEKDFKNPLKEATIIQRGVDLKAFDSKKISQNSTISLSKKWALPEDKQIILFPARFTAWKGHEFLIESLSRVKNEDFCLVMLGSDHGHEKFRKKIEEKIIEKNLGNKVKMVGVCKEMPVAYALSNFVICPSIRPEAFGRIAIEAQASSKIIIATNIGGSLETIIDQKTGFLVEVHDTEKLAKTIDFILNMSKIQVDEIGLAGRKHMEDNFSNEKMCEKTVEVYKKLLIPSS